MQPKGLHGHFRHERCAAIAFVERPFMGKSSAFIAFINVDGGIMFKVFVGRDRRARYTAISCSAFMRLRTVSRRPARRNRSAYVPGRRSCSEECSTL